MYPISQNFFGILSGRAHKKACLVAALYAVVKALLVLLKVNWPHVLLQVSRLGCFVVTGWKGALESLPFVSVLLFNRNRPHFVPNVHFLCLRGRGILGQVDGGWFGKIGSVGVGVISHLDGLNQVFFVHLILKSSPEFCLTEAYLST